jgi:uncharacterized protein YbcV (DUF1398 family)
MKKLENAELVKLVNAEMQSDLNDYDNLSNLLWSYGYETDYGHRSCEYYIEKGVFTEEVSDFVENELHGEFFDYYGEWLSSAASDSLRDEPEQYEHIEDEDERWECAMESVDCDGFIYGGFLNYIKTCVYLCLDDTDEIIDKLSDEGFVADTNDIETHIIESEIFIEDGHAFVEVNTKKNTYIISVVYDYDSGREDVEYTYNSLDELIEAGKVYLEKENELQLHLK